jgi:urease subunit beta
MIPGEYLIEPGFIELNEGRTVAQVSVTNTGDRPVQIGSHFHFFEVNKQLVFSRKAAFGMRLEIPAGTAVRFEPGEEKSVQLVAFGGSLHIAGFHGLANDRITPQQPSEAVMEDLSSKQFKNTE